MLCLSLALMCVSPQAYYCGYKPDVHGTKTAGMHFVMHWQQHGAVHSPDLISKYEEKQRRWLVYQAVMQKLMQSRP